MCLHFLGAALRLLKGEQDDAGISKLRMESLWQTLEKLLGI